MWFGDDIIYKCPNCNRFYSKPTLLSGNSGGAKLFSDTYSYEPMNPKWPDITKCTNCNTLLWLYKMKKSTGKEYVEKHGTDNWKDRPIITDLNLDDYIDIIENKAYETVKDEVFIRIRIVWAFNDRLRENKKLFENKKEEQIWTVNNIRLIKLLNYEDIEQRILLADIYRNAGNFQTCSAIISSIENEEYNWIKPQYEKEIEKGNRLVFQLDLTE